METHAWHPVTPEGTLPEREGKRVACAGREVALFNLGGRYLAVDNRCPHKSGPLSDGIVSGDAVFCPLHNWKISLESGCAIAGGEGKVGSYPVRVRNGVIEIGFEKEPAAR